jgi:hypothetical protein
MPKIQPNTKKKIQSKIETLNAEFRAYFSAQSENARRMVLEWTPLAAKIMIKETGGAWPEKSLTDGMINKSQKLCDLFAMLSKADRSELVRSIKTVYLNFDAIVTYGEANGYSRIESMAKAIRRAEKKAIEAAEPQETVEPQETAEPQEAADDTFAEKSLDHFAQEVLKVLRSAKNAGFMPSEVIGRIKEMQATHAKADAQKDIASAA